MGKPKPKNAIGQKYFGLITVDAKPPIKARTVTKNKSPGKYLGSKIVIPFPVRIGQLFNIAIFRLITDLDQIVQKCIERYISNLFYREFGQGKKYFILCQIKLEVVCHNIFTS